MPNILPYLGSYSSTDESDYVGVIHDYPDGTEREYYPSSFKTRTVVINFTSISLTKRNALQAFYEANKKLDVYVYVWPTAQQSDLTGNTGTGRFTARIRGPLQWTNNASCTYSGSLTFKIKS